MFCVLDIHGYSKGQNPAPRARIFQSSGHWDSTKSGASVLCVLDLPHHKKGKYVETVRMMGLPRSPLAGTDGLARMDTLPTLVDGPISSFDRFHQPRLHATPVPLEHECSPGSPGYTMYLRSRGLRYITIEHGKMCTS